MNITLLFLLLMFFLYYITLHYIILYYITLHYIILHYITLHYIILYYIILYYIILYYTILYYTISYHIISYHIISYHIISYYIILYYIMSCYVLFYYIISHSLKNTANQRPGLPLHILRYATGSISLYFPVIPCARGVHLKTSQKQAPKPSTPACEPLRTFPITSGNRFRKFPNTSEDFQRFSENFKKS